MNEPSVNGDEKGAFLNSMGQSNLAPLWEVYEKLVVNEPTRAEPSVIWKWDDMLPLIEKSGELVHGKEAQHRVLIMKNPHLDGRPWATSNMVAGYQYVLPGERTSPHRHTPAATRVVLEGEGSGTFVDGKRFEMNEGDLLIAPNWTWHSHENDSAKPAIWLDVVDLPLVGQFDAVFGQLSKPEGETYPDNVSTLRYPWNEMLGALDASAPGPDGAQWVNYTNPVDGSPILPTLDSRALSLAEGKPTQSGRSMANELFVVLEGNGESRIGDVHHGWGPKDVFTVPHWSWARHEARGGTAHIIVISDREIMKRLDLYREETD